MKNKILPALLSLMLMIGLGLFSVQKAYAQENNSWVPLIFQKFIDRFSLNKDEVDQFVQEQHEVRQQEMKTGQEDRLSQLVTEGKITEEQKILLINKMEERKQSREQDRQNFIQWAQDNGIDPAVLRFGRHGFKAGGPSRGDL